jgi:hypothetical protein
MKIFSSSVQKEFATERKALADYLSGDPLLRRFFGTFLFERDVPASDRRPDSVYLEEVRNCDLYPTKYIERMGTGILDMIRRCRKAGLAEPEIRIDGGSFVLTIRRKKAEPGTKSAPRRAQDKAHEAQDEAHVLLTPIEIGLLAACATSPRAIHELLDVAGYSSRIGNFKRSMDKLLQGDLLAMTIPDKPRSGNQRYKATAKGKALLAKLEKQGGNP